MVLAVNFDNNTRTFALSTHVYFIMSFVNPKVDAFGTFPTSADCYVVLILGGSCAAVMCVLFSRRRRALIMAEEKAVEASETVAMVLEALPRTPEELTRQKIALALAETAATRVLMEENLEYSWFEDLGQGARAVRRRRLTAVGKCLLTASRHVPGLLHAAAALSQEDREVLEGFDSLQVACTGARSLLLGACTGAPEEQGLDCAAEDFSERVSADFVATRRDLSPEACAFMFMLCGVLSDVARAVDSLFRTSVQRQRLSGLRERLRHFARSTYLHFGMQVDRSVTHPRFVLRNTCRRRESCRRINFQRSARIYWIGVGSLSLVRGARQGRRRRRR
ncbi:unnamed protein product [Prorocentrum cordatum]|uniref:Uncharacterized protein n=1 Tax=Prorocentrum cordatum TaxID=2364126 RepID=A0ABN9XNB1_9DINO|nr:unnamed protein product [Polarella glacialis]